MRIGLDVRPFLKKPTGVGIYFKNLLFSLSRLDHVNEYYLFSASFKDRFPSSKIPPFAHQHFRDFRFPVKMINHFWYRLCWPPLDYFFFTSLDVTHSPTPLVIPTKGKKLVTVYDLFFMDFPHLTDKEARKEFIPRIRASLKQADGIVAISRFSQQRLMQKFALPPSKIKVIHLGIDHRFWNDISTFQLAETKKRYGLPSSFILFVGAMEPRKNLTTLVKALKCLHNRNRKIPLIMVGRKGEDYKRIKKEINEQSLDAWVKMLGYVPEEDLKNLYRLASVLVFPSMYEGFGLPVLEAMVSGLPVVTSQTSALVEIAQDAALYFNPDSPDEIAEKTLLAMDHRDLHQSLAQKGKKRALDFDWRKTAAETLSFYQQVVNQR
ncbi:MAG: glycosyltransferase family 4 protein [Candidatus Aminicenantes bacterium]